MFFHDYCLPHSRSSLREPGRSELSGLPVASRPWQVLRPFDFHAPDGGATSRDVLDCPEVRAEASVHQPSARSHGAQAANLIRHVAGADTKAPGAPLATGTYTRLAN